MKFEQHLLEIKNQNISENNLLLKIFSKEKLFNMNTIDLKFEIINLYLSKKSIYTEIYILDILNDIEIQKYIKLNFPNIKIEKIIIDINKNKNNKKENIKFPVIFTNIFTGIFFIQFKNIQESIVIPILTNDNKKNDFPEIQSVIFTFIDLASVIFYFLGIIFMIRGIYLLYRYSNEDSISEENIHIELNNKSTSNSENLNYFILIDSFLSNKNMNIDLETFSLIFYKEEYISYILKNYKYNLIDVIYEKNSVSHINLQLKSNEDILNKFCVFLIEHDLLENKDYEIFAQYVNRYSTNKTLLYFIKNEKVFTSNLFNKSLKRISL